MATRTEVMDKYSALPCKLANVRWYKGEKRLENRDGSGNGSGMAANSSERVRKVKEAERKVVKE